MTGLYPDPPGPRIAYDRDGTIGVSYTTGGVVTTLTGTQMTNLNDESQTTTVAPGSGGLALLFPQLMTIQGWFHSRETSGSAAVTFSTSTNTTNGFDGTWTAWGTTLSNVNNVNPGYRNLIKTTTAVTGIKGVRVNAAGGTFVFQALHVYGKPTSVTGDKLELWHPTLDQPLAETPAHFEYGDVARSASIANRAFRVKNLSAALTANTITISREALTDTTHLSEITMQYNGGAFGNTASIPSLAPGAISELVVINNAPGASSTLSTATMRLITSAGSWT